MCMALVLFFSETCRTAAYSHLHNGPRVTDLLFYPAKNVDELVCVCGGGGEGFSISLIGTTFPLY